MHGTSFHCLSIGMFLSVVIFELNRNGTIQHLHGGSEEKQKNLFQKSLSQDWDMNPEPPVYEAGVQCTGWWCLVVAILLHLWFFSSDGLCRWFLPMTPSVVIVLHNVAEVPRVLNFLVPFTSLKSVHLHLYEQSLGIPEYVKLKIVGQWMDMVESATSNWRE